jgi:hypothetical protein
MFLGFILVFKVIISFLRREYVINRVYKYILEKGAGSAYTHGAVSPAKICQTGNKWKLSEEICDFRSDSGDHCVVKDVGECGKKQRTQYDGNDDLDTIGNVEIAALIAKSVVDTGLHG